MDEVQNDFTATACIYKLDELNSLIFYLNDQKKTPEKHEKEH